MKKVKIITDGDYKKLIEVLLYISNNIDRNIFMDTQSLFYILCSLEVIGGKLTTLNAKHPIVNVLVDYNDKLICECNTRGWEHEIIEI